MQAIFENAKLFIERFSRRDSRALAAAVFVIAALLYALPLSGTEIFTRGEAREALVVRAMIDQDNFVLPLRNGTAIPSKPPFYHWCAALPFYLFDSRAEFWLRLPSALAAALALAGFFMFAAARLDKESALLGTIVLATAFDWTRAATAARVDMMFCLWVSLGSLCLFKFSDAVGKRPLNYPLFLLSAISLGFAALTKGPAGIVLPWMVAAIFLLCTVPLRRIPIGAMIVSVTISALIAALWYLSAYYQRGFEFLDVQLMRENVARLTGDQEYQTGHRASPLAIIPMLLSGILPWSLFLPPLIVCLYQRRKTLLSADPAVLFCIIWALSYLLLFSLLSSKRNVYLLPSYPAYAYLFAASARAIDMPARARKISAAAFATCAAIIVIAAALIVVSMFVDVSSLYARLGSRKAKIELFPIIHSALQWFLPLLLASLLFLNSSLRRYVSGSFRAAAYPLAAFATIVSIGTQIFVLSRLGDFSSPKHFLSEIKDDIPAGAPFFQYREEFYAADFYANRELTVIEATPPLTNATEGYILLAKSDIEDAQRNIPGLQILKTSGYLDVYGTDRFVLAKFPAASAA